RQVTISSFYMDDSEISNSEYRQFVNWVRDSILIYNYLGDDSYFVDVEGTGERYIDWNKVNGGRRSLWSTNDPTMRDRMRQMYYQGEDRVFGKDELDVRLLRSEERRVGKESRPLRWQSHEKSEREGREPRSTR